MNDKYGTWIVSGSGGNGTGTSILRGSHSGSVFQIRPFSSSVHSPSCPATDLKQAIWAGQIEKQVANLNLVRLDPKPKSGKIRP